MLWAGLGEVAAVVLESVRAVPKKALALGYQFKFPEIGGAMKDLLKK
jgi:NAD dependent epimerase/dehydratase family enzyme